MCLPLLTQKGRQGHGDILKQLTKLIEMDQIKPLLDEENFSFENVSKAHEKLESGKAIGKIVMTV